MNTYYVYIMTNKSRTLYVGMTSNLEWRVRQHKTKQIAGFTSKYNVTRLAFYESFPTALDAIAAEKRIKGWTRIKKLALIESKNPDWVDLATDWFGDLPASRGDVPTPTRRWNETARGFRSSQDRREVLRSTSG